MTTTVVGSTQYQLSLPGLYPGAKPAYRFDGPEVEPEDVRRLTGQLEAVYRVMTDRRWRTLETLAAEVGRETERKTTTQSVSARLRDLRKRRFGGYKVERRRVDGGLFEYRLWSR